MTKSKKQKSNSKSFNNKNDVIPAPLPPRASAVESQPKTRSSAAESQPQVRESAAEAEHEIRASAAEKKIDLDWMGSGFKPVVSSGSGGGNAADRSNHNRGVCHNFMSGHCNRGDSCRYSHNRAGIAKQKARGASGALDKPWEGLLPGKTIAEAKATHAQLMPMLMQGSGGGRRGGQGGRKRRAINNHAGGAGERHRPRIGRN